MKRRGPVKSQQRESGYALLFIFAMAATVAIMLYMEIPRIAFEAQRDKEQLLIDRGEQYSRAVNLYVRKFNRFPVDFDALQNTQNLRFLRRKYVDPMTGKDDWRIVHVGPGGVFIDSLVYGKKKDDKQQAEQQNFITEAQQTGGNQAEGTQGVNLAARLRQSDQPGAPGDPNNQNQIAQPGLPQPGLPQLDANGQPIPQTPNGNVAPAQQGNLPGQFQTGTNGFPPGIQMPPGQTFGGVQGQQPGPQPNAPLQGAAGLINQILTSPRPGGLNGLGGVPQPPVDPNGNPISNANGIGNNATAAGTLSSPSLPTPAAAPVAAQTIGGGLAGVASKYEQDGIKIYKEQTTYNKWEFVYDITKDPARGAGAVPQAAPAPNAVPGQTPIPAQTNTTVPGSAAAQILPPVPPPPPVTPPQ
jgi:hypothetical protein